MVFATEIIRTGIFYGAAVWIPDSAASRRIRNDSFLIWPSGNLIDMGGAQRLFDYPLASGLYLIL